MATLETIRRIRVEASERGLPQLEAALERYENTMEAVGVAMDSTDKKTQSAARAFEAMQKRVDPLHREMSQLSREFTVMQRAAEQGMGIAEQARNLDLLFAKTTAAKEAAAERARVEAEAAKKAEQAAKELAAAQEKAARDAQANAEKVTEALRKQRDMYRAANAPDAHVNAFRQAQARQAQAAEEQQRQLQRAASPFDTHVAAFRQQQAARQAADADEVARSVARLRAEFMPTAHAADLLEQQLIQLEKAEKRGALSAEDAAQIRTQATARLQAIARDHAGKIGMTISQNTQLAYQMNDIISGLAMGQAPLTVLVQQGGQVYQALADTPGGAAQGARLLGQRILGFITPMRVAMGTFAGMATGAAALVLSFENLERSTSAVLNGLGRGLNMNFGQFYERMKGIAEQTGLSTREAVKFGAELARTGRLGTEAIEDIISISKDFGATIGVDADAARQKLLNAFRDPAQGIEALRREFNLVDINAEKYIDSLIRMGRNQEAVRAFVAQLRGELVKAEEVSGRMETLWDRIANRISNAALTIGAALDNTITKFDKWQQGRLGGPIEGLTPIIPGAAPQAPAATGGMFEGFQTSREMAGGTQAMLRQGLLRSGNADIAKTTVELKEQAAAVQGYIRELGVGTPLRQKYIDMEKAIQEAIRTGNPMLRDAVTGWDNVNEALDKVSHARRTMVTEEQKAEQLRANEIRQNAALTPMQRAAAEAEAVRIRNKGELKRSTEAEAEAQHVLNVALAAQQAQLQQMNQATEMSIRETQREAEVMSMASGEREIALAKIRAENELTRMGIPIQGELAQSYIRLKEALAQANQERSRAALMADLQFERDQMGRSEIDRSVASRLRGAGLAQDDAIGAQIKLNQQLEIGRDLAMDFGKGFAQDLRAGTDAAEALTNALDRVADKLIDMAMDMAISSLFKGITGSGGLSGLFGGGGLATMSAGGMGPDMPVGIGHTGGIVDNLATKRFVHPAYFDDAPRFHKGGMIAPDEVPIIARKGEGVFTPGQMAAMGQANVVINPVIENHTDSKVRTEVTRGQNGEVNIKTFIQQQAAEGVSQPGNPLSKAVRQFGSGMPLTRR